MDCSFAGAACAFLCCNIGVFDIVAGSLRLDTKVQMASKQQESQGIFKPTLQAALLVKLNPARAVSTCYLQTAHSVPAIEFLCRPALWIMPLQSYTIRHRSVLCCTWFCAAALVNSTICTIAEGATLLLTTRM